MLENRIDKNAFTIHNLHDDQNDLLYWLNKSPQDRISAIEMMRIINYGNDIITTRLQRLFEVTEFPQS